MPAPEVGIVVIHPKTVTLTAELPGRGTPYRISEVRPQVNGIVVKRLFTEGSEVKAGQPLYQIDPAMYRAVFEEARADLASAKASLVLTVRIKQAPSSRITGVWDSTASRAMHNSQA